MFATEQIAGHECNLTLSKDGRTIRALTILVGSADQPGWRRKDGAREKRREVRDAVVAAIRDDPRAAWLLRAKRPRCGRIRVVARYSSLVDLGDGVVGRRDDTGRVTGSHLAD